MKFNKLTATALLLATPSLVMGGKGPASSSASLSSTQESHPTMLNQSKQPAPKPGIANTSRPPTRPSRHVVRKDIVAFSGIKASAKDVQVSMVILQSFCTQDVSKIPAKLNHECKMTAISSYSLVHLWHFLQCN